MGVWILDWLCGVRSLGLSPPLTLTLTLTLIGGQILGSISSLVYYIWVIVPYYTSKSGLELGLGLYCIWVFLVTST